MLSGQDHFAHGVNTISLEEHVLGAAEADAGGAEGDGVGGLFGGIGVGADGHAGGLVAPLHQLKKVLTDPALLDIQGLGDEHLDDFRGRGLDFAGINFAGGAVNGEEIPFVEGLAAHGEGFFGVIHLQSAGAADANLAHLAGHQRGVGTDAAAGGQNAFGGDHARAGPPGRSRRGRAAPSGRRGRLPPRARR